MNARTLVHLAIREGHAEDGPVRIIAEDMGLLVLRSDGRVSIGVNGLTTRQAAQLVDVFRASTEATDVLVRTWLARELATSTHATGSPSCTG